MYMYSLPLHGRSVVGVGIKLLRSYYVSQGLFYMPFIKNDVNISVLM